MKVPTVLTLQWYSHGFAVNFFVAEFADVAVVSPWFYSALCTDIAVVSAQFRSQLPRGIRGRVCLHHSLILTVLRSASSRPSSLTFQWYPHGFTVHCVVTLQWYPHSVAVNYFMAAIADPPFSRSTSSWHSWPSLLAPQSYPHGCAVNFFVAEFADIAVVSPQFRRQLLYGRDC